MERKNTGILDVGLLVVLICIASVIKAQCQSKYGPDPKFAAFSGVVYDVPEIRIKKDGIIKVAIQDHYARNIYNYPVIGQLSLDEINVSETKLGEGKFPEVDKAIEFATILHSTMEVLVDGMYEFSLTSDDGSILWIDDKEVINNDGEHRMKLKVDTLEYKKGFYDVKLWYYQGADRFGFIMNAKNVGRSQIQSDVDVANFRKSSKVITLSSILFDTDVHWISDKGMEELNAAIAEIKEYNPTKIRIVGHTDNKGAEDYNLDLSLKRAESIKDKLHRLFNTDSIELIVAGLGSSSPIASNESAEGQKLNRRVELIFE